MTNKKATVIAVNSACLFDYGNEVGLACDKDVELGSRLERAAMKINAPLYSLYRTINTWGSMSPEVLWNRGFGSFLARRKSDTRVHAFLNTVVADLEIARKIYFDVIEGFGADHIKEQMNPDSKQAICRWIDSGAKLIIYSHIHNECSLQRFLKIANIPTETVLVINTAECPAHTQHGVDFQPGYMGAVDANLLFEALKSKDLSLPIDYLISNSKTDLDVSKGPQIAKNRALLSVWEKAELKHHENYIETNRMTSLIAHGQLQ